MKSLGENSSKCVRDFFSPPSCSASIPLRIGGISSKAGINSKTGNSRQDRNDVLWRTKSLGVWGQDLKKMIRVPQFLLVAAFPVAGVHGSVGV